MTPRSDTALRRLFHVVNGGTPTSDDRNWGGGIHWATPVDLGRVHGRCLDGTDRTLSDAGLRSGSAAVPAGSLIVSTRAPIGYVAETTTLTAFNQGCKGLIPTTPLNTRFYRYVLVSMSSQLQTAGQGSTFVELSGDALAQQRVPRRRRAVQRAIADFLDTETARIDALITKKRRMIQLLEEWFVAQRSSLVLRGLHPIHGEARQPAAQGPWNTVALGVLIVLHRGFDLPVDARELGSVPVVSSGGISGTHSESMCDPPGIVTGRYGTIGEVFFVAEPFWPLNTTLFVSDFRGNDPRWVYHLLAALPLDFDAEKSAVTGINRNVIGALRCPRLPVEEQHKIAKALDACVEHRDRTVAPLRRQVELLQEHRQALITAAVTGELEVPGVAA